MGNNARTPPRTKPKMNTIRNSNIKTVPTKSIIDDDDDNNNVDYLCHISTPKMSVYSPTRRSTAMVVTAVVDDAVSKRIDFDEGDQQQQRDVDALISSSTPSPSPSSLFLV